MQIVTSTESDIDFEAALQVLLDDPTGLFNAATTAALEALRDAPDAGAVDLGDEVTVTATDPNPTWNQAMTMDVRWRTARDDTLFAGLRGVVEVSSSSQSPPRTQLSFIGSYRPRTDGAPDESAAKPVALAAIGHVLASVARRLDGAS